MCATSSLAHLGCDYVRSLTRAIHPDGQRKVGDGIEIRLRSGLQLVRTLE
jgi:hypothetical protein